MSKQYKKFGELSRTEQLEWVEHALDGGKVELFSKTRWYNNSRDIHFYKDCRYRKFKSELDLLKEQRHELDEKIRKLGGDISVGDIVIRKADMSRKQFEVKEIFSFRGAFLIGCNLYSKDRLNEEFIKVK